MKKPGVSQILGANTTASPVVTEAVPPLTSMAAVQKRTLTRAVNKTIRIHLPVDKSGSYVQNEPARINAQDKFVGRILDDPNLAGMVLLCVTEMSAVVKSSGYLPIKKFVPENITAGGTSPFATLLEATMAEDVRSAQQDAITIHVPMGDWFSCEEMDAVMVKYHEHQKSHCGGVHVFPVCMGQPINTELAKTVSIRYQPYTDPNTAFDEIFDHIFNLISNVSLNADALKTYRSLTESQLKLKEV